MSILTLSSPSFAIGTKKGIMKPDETGYYDVSMGGLNTTNTKGEFYIAEGVVQLFGTASRLSRRISRGELNSEIGHPVREAGMSDAAFYNRALTIREDRVCSNIRKVYLDHDFGKNNGDKANRDAICIRGLITPAGPYADTVQRAIDNPYSQLAYSIRAITDIEVRNGKVYKKITMPITFDYVNSPGIVFATKDNSLSLESEDSLPLDTLIDVDLMKEILVDSTTYFGLESGEEEFKEEVLEAVSRTNEIIKKDKKIFLW